MAWNLIVDQKMNQGYQGHAESCDWKFMVPLPDQVGAQWIADRIVNAHVEELAEQNAKLLELRVWEDTSPTWNTEYYVQTVSTASPLYWSVIIVGVLVILALAGASYILLKIEDIVKYIGEKSPMTLPLMAIAAIGAITVAGIYLVRRKT